MLNKPSIKEVKETWQDGGSDSLEIISDVADGTWRHGTEHTLILKRLEDETYWSISYRSQGDGEYNDLRDDDLSDGDVYQVVPKTVTKTIYVSANKV